MSLVIPVLLLLFTIPLVVALLRANELFCLRVTGGRLRVVRGRIPQRLLNDISDVLRAPTPSDCLVRGFVEDGCAAVVVTEPISPEQKQRLRNILAAWPVAKIRNAPRPR